MRISQKLLQEIYEDTTPERVERGKRYARQGRVTITEVYYDGENNFEIKGEVEGNYDNYNTKISVRNAMLEKAECECEDYYNNYGICKHIIATIEKFGQTKYWDNSNNFEKQQKKAVKYTNFQKIVTAIYNEELEEINTEELQEIEDKIKIEPKIILDRFESKLKMEFRIGIKRMYKIKDLSDFYTRMQRKEYYKYGDRLEFMHTRENFREEDQKLLDVLLKYAEMLKYAENTAKYSYYGSTLNHTSITLGESSLDEMFDILKNKKVTIDIQKKNNTLELIEQNPNIEFEITENKKGEYKLSPNIDPYETQIFNGRDYTYLLINEKLYRCDKEYTETTIKLIKLFKEIYAQELEFSKSELKDLYSIVIPRVGNCIKLKGIDEKEIEEYKPKKLGVKIYLDYDENDYIVADVKFCYGEEEFNPLDETLQIEAPRNRLEENKSLNIIRKTGFMVEKKKLRFILPDNDSIYNFLSNDIELYMKKFEVLATENFKTKEIKKPKMGTIGIKVENNLLSVDLSKINIDTKELQDIMEKYQLKKKYHRLKDGSFINLEENEDIEFLDKFVSGMDLEYEDLNKENIKLPISRSLYLNELLKNEKIVQISKNNEFKKIVNDLEQDNINEDINIPDEMNEILRDYQKIGFRWLKVLDSYHFGGILADDMGLGKTLQVLSIILDYTQKEEDKKATLVVSPSSLTLNWLNEAKKFAPNLKVDVVRGTGKQRKDIINNIEKCDLIITSYDLLKRDIKAYEEKNYTFRYLIADEAQYMKNSTTQNAKAIKTLNAISRFALTGTPIENSLSELWSIFDFVMPGYLFKYKKFKEMYESPIVKENDEKATKKLKMLIEPFILRRTKKEVLTELPEKTITIMNNQMNEEQEKIYMSYLTQVKEDVAKEISINGFEKSQIKILAALTRLRQICCHPELFLKNYKGESSKLTRMYGISRRCN